MDAETRAELARIEQRMLELVDRRTRNIPIPPRPPPARQLLRVIGGQTSNGVAVIKYAATDPVLTQLYDPDVDTTYPEGIGHSWLYEGGEQLQRVLTRHDYGGGDDYAMGASPTGGWIYEVRGIIPLTVASGADAGAVRLFYQLGAVL